MDMIKALTRRLSIEQGNLRTHIQIDLKRAIASFQRAQESLAAGEELDEHLIQNMMLLVTYIARHNSLLQILPYLKEESGE